MLTGQDQDAALEEQGIIEQLYQQWLLGSESGSAENIPSGWQPLLEKIPEERRAITLLALVSQHQSILLKPKPGTRLSPHPILPVINKPTLPNGLRPLFNRLLATARKTAKTSEIQLIKLLLSRGYLAHPGDWLPSATSDELPAIYFPWAQWSANELTTIDADTEELTEDNWDEWFPAQRLAQLRQLRIKDPVATRELIASCAPNEPADKRVKIIRTLAINLQEADSEYLLSLLTDRSQKVVQVARQFLARLGKSRQIPDGEDLQEQANTLAEYYEIKSSGLLKKRRQIIPKKLKSKKQQAVRTELLTKVALDDFAQALQTDINKLVSDWHFSANRDIDNQNFIANAVNTLADTAIQALIENLLTSIQSEVAAFSWLDQFAGRLPDDTRSALAHELLCSRHSEIAFNDLLSLANGPLQPSLTWSQLQASASWKNLMNQVQKKLAKQGYLDDHQMEDEFKALGLLLNSDVAEHALNTLVEMGVLKADPIIDFLKLNAALKPHQAPNATSKE